VIVVREWNAFPGAARFFPSRRLYAASFSRHAGVILAERESAWKGGGMLKLDDTFAGIKAI
jgi:hypothetical protein